MRFKLHTTVSLIGLIALATLYPSRPAPAFSKVVITTSSLSEREAALHVAQDREFFKKHGVEAMIVQVRTGPLAIAALSAGESHLHWGSVTSANLGAIAAGADLVFLAGFINRLSGMFVTHPRLSTPTDLRGKIIGVNTLSGGGGVFTSLALEHWGLSAERDKIQFRALGNEPTIAQALGAGAVDAAYHGYVYGKMMQSKGFRVLADFETLPIPYQGSGIIGRRNFVISAPDAISGVMRAIVDAVRFVLDPANKAAALRIMAKGTPRARPEDIEEGYQRVIKLYERKPYPSLAGIRNAIRVLGMQFENIRKLKAEELVMDDFVRNLDREGRIP